MPRNSKLLLIRLLKYQFIGNAGNLFFTAAYLAFSFFLLISIISCTEEKSNGKNSKDTLNYALQPDQTGWDVEVFFIDSSFTKAILKAKRTRVFSQRYETLMDGGLHVDFLSKETGKVMSVLTSDSARVDDRTKDMLASGNVVVLGDSSKTKLETSILFWNNLTQKLYTTKFVKITRPNETIMGYGFESDQYLLKYKIFKVSGVQR